MYCRQQLLGMLPWIHVHSMRCWLLSCRSVLLIQSTWRMLKHRRAFLRQRRAAVAIQARVKGRQARAAVAVLRKQHAAATRVQSRFRGHRARQDYLLQRDAAVAVQMGFRRRQVSMCRAFIGKADSVICMDCSAFTAISRCRQRSVFYSLFKASLLQVHDNSGISI